MRVATSQDSLYLHGVFAVLLLANFIFWLSARSVLPQWNNVPPAPRKETASFSGLGDSEISYRLAGYFLQNLGNTGGRFASLKDYDYASLGGWFDVVQFLDERADYVPFLAAYYFGAIEGEPKKLDPVIEYLVTQGEKPYPQKWRWLAQAVYLARYKQQDLPKALQLANRLASLKTETAPWARQMPAFIHYQMGDKQAAYEIMTHMLATEHERLHPNEVNAMRDYICTKTLTRAQAGKSELCKN